MCEVIVLKDGYSRMQDGFMYANATCSVVKSPENTVIVDTMTPWDGGYIKTKLKELNITKIDYVVSTHGHPDHTGNNNLFLESTHIVGYCIHRKDDQFILHPFEQGHSYEIDKWIKVIPIPGHTNEDIGLEVENKDGKKVVIAGDLFESEEDTENPYLWLGNSFDPGKQAVNRVKVLKIADFIIPGHGPMFEVKPSYIEAAQKMCDDFEKEKQSTITTTIAAY